MESSFSGSKLRQNVSIFPSTHEILEMFWICFHLNQINDCYVRPIHYSYYCSIVDKRCQCFGEFWNDNHISQKIIWFHMGIHWHVSKWYMIILLHGIWPECKWFTNLDFIFYIFAIIHTDIGILMTDWYTQSGLSKMTVVIKAAFSNVLCSMIYGWSVTQLPVLA